MGERSGVRRNRDGLAPGSLLGDDSFARFLARSSHLPRFAPQSIEESGQGQALDRGLHASQSDFGNDDHARLGDEGSPLFDLDLEILLEAVGS